jgi:chromosome segregation ATPase
MICKMVKKGLVGTALTGGLLALLFGTSAPNYVLTAFHKVRHSAQRAVPIEFEIDKARQEIAKLEPAIQDQMEVLVKAEFEAERLEKEIVAKREQLNQEGRELQALNERLKTGDLHLTGGVAYTDKEIKNDLVRRMDYYKNLKSSLAAKQETLKVRQKNVIAARDGLTAMQAARRDLKVRLEGVEARLNQLKATRAQSEFSFDDSAVGKAKESVTELESRLEQMARLDELKDKYAERGISVTVEPSRDVSKEIDAEFGAGFKKEAGSSATNN